MSKFNLSPAKRALLDALLKGREIDLSSSTAIPKRSSEDLAPLSFAQRRMWFLHQMEGSANAYNVPVVFHLRGRLSLQALEKSLNQIVQRHEILRTTFQDLDGDIRQIIAPSLALRVRVIDLRAEIGEDKIRRANQILITRGQEKFDLVRGPLLNVDLIELSDQDYYLLINLHHIIIDEWSSDLFFRELEAFYSEAVVGVQASLPELAVQYADFSVWQLEWLKGSLFDKQLAYWKDKLSGAPASIDLKTDFPRPAEISFRGSHKSRHISSDLLEGIKELSRAEGVTLFSTFLTAFNVLLYRYTRQADVLIGTPITNRRQVELQSLIGFFLNTLVLRTDLRGKPAFRQLLKRVNAEVLEAFDHQDLPFERLVEELRPERDLSRHPLFQIAFVLQTVGTHRFQLPDMEVRRVRPDFGVSKFDLTLYLTDNYGDFEARFEYSLDLFAADTIQQILVNFETLLHDIVANPDKSIEDLALLTPAEREHILVDWNDTYKDYPASLLVHQLFEAHVKLDPDAIAIVFGGHPPSSIPKGTEHENVLTYGELNSRANRLAHYLRAHGVGPECLVGVCMHRSLEMVVALLGVMKAGGAYLPLDPAYPSDRLGFMVNDAGLKHVITQQGTTHRLEGQKLQPLILDRDWREFDIYPTTDPINLVNPLNRAYLIYTSGSTGLPKGMELDHGGLLNLVQWHRDVFGVGPADRATQMAGLSFDASVWEIWPYLASGAQIHLLADERDLAPHRLLDWLCREGITIAFLPTPVAESILDLGWPAETSLRTLLTGGDRLNRHPPSGLPFRLVNNYGPTECTVVATSGFVPPPGVEAGALGTSLPAIGRPISNVRLYVLDGLLNPTPAGVPGELYIAGAGVGRGYLNQPALTAERFIPDPFLNPEEGVGGRLYRTGDVVRFLSDGQLEFLGRSDDQIKLRGLRIELGEIEAALTCLPQVEKAVAMLRKNADRDFLAAYVVLHPGRMEEAQALQSFLRRSLPEYMVPESIFFLDTLPLTPNGKIDRKALPAPDVNKPHAPQGSVSPRDSIERQLCQIWQRVLGVEKVGIEDNFFERGGHSLLAIQLVSQIEQELAARIPLTVLFQFPTVAGQADFLRNNQDRGPRQLISPRDWLEPAPLSFGQERMLFLERLGMGAGSYNVPAAYRLVGGLDANALERCLNRIVERHAILRMRVVEFDGESRQIAEPGLKIGLERIDLRAFPRNERENESMRLLRELGRKPFDLTSELLLRAHLIMFGDEESFFLLNLHHMVVDEWSFGILQHELMLLYQAEIQSLVAILPELTFQYADFAAWQVYWLNSPAVEGQLNYWKKQLAGAPQVLDLPMDHPRPVLQSFRGATCTRQISSISLDALHQLCQTERVTLFTALLSAFQVLLYRYTGQDDLLVGSPIANRRQPGVENLIGFFLNTLVFRAELSGSPSFREVLKRAERTVLDAFDNQDLPFEHLVEELRPRRDLSRHPLFQVAFALHPSAVQKLQLEGLEVAPVRVDYGWAKFDLTLYLTESPAGLSARMEYSSDLFEPTTVDRMLTHFEVLLQGIGRDPDRSINSLPMLTEAENRQMLRNWNRTQTDYPRLMTVHHLFEVQASKSPDAVALVARAPDQIDQGLSLSYRMTYDELNRRSNQLARYLRELEVGRHNLVGISMERAPEMVVAMLAVLKAGGSYVPLDPGYPPERVAFMIADARLKVLLSLSGWSSEQPESNYRVVSLDQDWPEIASRSPENLSELNEPADLAYIMYTSGSTGQPKGIGIPHQAINRLVRDTDYVRLEQGDRIAQASNMSFDAATFEVWGALTNGGCLVIIPQEIVLDPVELAKVLRQEQVQTLFVTTALFNQIAMLEPGAFQSLRDVLFGGEAVTVGWVRAVLEAGSPARLLHVYGPTEGTTFTTWYTVHEVADSDKTVPIGKAIANTRVYVLDRWLNPVPIGVAGELFIGGDGLADGYFKRPELTAEKFLPDPYSVPGGRMYRTGDLVRFLPDGNIEFLGRIDHQIKLRGFRVELGEIESVLNDHPAVDQSIVTIVPDRDRLHGEKRLAAYIVPRSETGLKPQELRAHLKRRLPEYMIPASFVFLESLPITPNGKVDRASLPAPTPERQISEGAYLGPRDPVERSLAQIWERVLDLRPIGMDEDFFELGGHSLLAVRLFTHIEQEMGAKLPLATLFQAPTIAELAAVMRQERLPADWSALIPIQPQGSRPPFFCVHNFGGEALDLAPLAQALGPAQPFFGLQALGLDGIQEPHETIEEMAAYYVKAIRDQQPHGPYHLGGYCFGGVVAFEMARQLDEAGEQVALVAAIDASAPGFARVTGTWSLSEIWVFITSLPYWVRDYFQMDRAERGVVVRRRLKRIQKALERLVGIQAEMTPLEVIGDHVHVMEAPAHRRSLMELHMRAIQNYRTPAYPGKVTAFRIRRMPLFSRHAFDMGWSQVARGGVDLRLVPGAHHNIMRAPYVQELARQITECMDQAGRDRC